MQSNITKKTDKNKIAVVSLFLSVPFASSLISTWHIFDMFELGNPTWMSVVLSIVIELGALASLLALANMKKLKMAYIWFIFVILFALQISGNVFYSYKFVTDMMVTHPTWLATFNEFMKVLGLVEDASTPMVKLILSCIIGLPIPLISLSFLKSTVDYLKPEDKIEEKGILKENIELLTQVKEEEVKEVKVEEKEVAEEVEEIVSTSNLMSTNPTIPLEEKLPYVEEKKEEKVEIQIPKENKGGIHIAVQPNINK